MVSWTRAPERASAWDHLRCLPQYLLPHHLLSWVVYGATRLRVGWWKNLLIRYVVRRYAVDLSEAAEPEISAYPHFNAFFTRPLRADARPLPAPDEVCCPADGTLSAVGAITAGTLLQAKGVHFNLRDLLGGSSYQAVPFQQGRYATIYLSPRDYHRVHMPLEGRLKEWIHIPGRLFSVAPHTTRGIPRLFARNERVVCIFDTAAGPMAVILVGAMLVSSVETVWHGPLKPPRPRKITRSNPEQSLTLGKGEELGRFNMGSTVIVLLPDRRVSWDERLQPGQALRMGQSLGHWHRGASG